MTNVLGVGIIGCGNISAAYLRLSPMFRAIEIRACADINPAAAKARAEEFDIKALTIDELLQNDDIDIVVNLTIPDAHYAVTKQILAAGKHAYSEKPLVLSMEQGLELKALADRRNLRVGCAPDTFLGGAYQLARREVDRGHVGRITSGTCHVMSHGMEHWHPNPDFFFKRGGGPILDLGPYYIANLINLIGPVQRVAALTSAATPTRTILSEPRKGEIIPVETPTTIHALLQFEQGATITLSASWDVWSHRHANMELYGTEGSLYLPDPNFFGGDVQLVKPGQPAITVENWDHSFGVANEQHSNGLMANYRAAGLADMAAAILEGRDMRCSLERALHGVDVMLAILKSGEAGHFVDVATTCTRPEALDIAAAEALLLPVQAQARRAMN